MEVLSEMGFGAHGVEPSPQMARHERFGFETVHGGKLDTWPPPSELLRPHHHVGRGGARGRPACPAREGSGAAQNRPACWCSRPRTSILSRKWWLLAGDVVLEPQRQLAHVRPIVVPAARKACAEVVDGVHRGGM